MKKDLSMRHNSTCTQIQMKGKKENDTRKHTTMQYSEVTNAMAHNQHAIISSSKRKKSKRNI